MKLFYAILFQLSAGLWTSSFIFDVLYFRSHSMNAGNEFAVSSFLCMLAGIVGAVVALGFGLSQYYRNPSRRVGRHLLVSLSVLILFTINLFSRLGLAEAQSPDQLIPIQVSDAQMVGSALGLVGLIVSEFFSRALGTSEKAAPFPQPFSQTRAG